MRKKKSKSSSSSSKSSSMIVRPSSPKSSSQKTSSSLHDHHQHKSSSSSNTYNRSLSQVRIIMSGTGYHSKFNCRTHCITLLFTSAFRFSFRAKKKPPLLHPPTILLPLLITTPQRSSSRRGVIQSWSHHRVKVLTRHQRLGQRLRLHSCHPWLGRS